ncbi:MAG: ParA family protein [Sciscionella sp.]
MRVVAVLSLKGGVGKTTVALGLASAALRRGLRTLVVDLDPQCNATTALDPPDTEASLADVLTAPAPTTVREAIAASPWGEGLDVLVGSEDVEALNHPDPSSRRLGLLRRALEQLPAAGLEPYHLVLLDCPPSLGQLTRSALAAAHRALLVTEPNMFAVAGVQRAFEAMSATQQEHNPELAPLGVLVNRYRPRAMEHQFRIDELRDIFGPLVLPAALPDRLAIQQAQGACQPIHKWDTPGAREAAVTFNLVLTRILRASAHIDSCYPDLEPDEDEEDLPEEDEVSGA